MRWTDPSLPGCPRRATRPHFAIATALLLLTVFASSCGRPPRAPAPVLASAPERTAVYTVQAGDTTERIAAWHDVDPAQIEHWNRLDAGAPLVPGRTLVLPFRPLATYTVQPGDTLGALADGFGVDAVSLAHLNEIADPRKLEVGAVLRIPHDAARTELVRAEPPRAPAPPRDAVAPAPPPREVAAPTRRRPNEADESLAAARTAFDAADFESALKWADRARESVRASSTDPADRRRLARAHLMSGMAEVALGRDDAARTSFGRALDLDGKIELDPRETSPKVLSVFREVRGR
jgi:LysM repeat protein